MDCNCYPLLTKFEPCPFFDDKPPQANGYIFCSDPRFYRIVKELKRDNHSARSLSNSMYTMRVIRAKGWTYFVNKTIDENGEKLGMVQYARANIRAN